ncbi:MAG: hypothetical protein R3B83_12000 [Nitrospirales bacterium]|nr:hypothetical protein [Nitrospirales bacterium]
MGTHQSTVNRQPASVQGHLPLHRAIIDGRDPWRDLRVLFFPPSIAAQAAQ